MIKIARIVKAPFKLSNFKFRQYNTVIDNPYNLPPLTEPLKKLVKPKFQKINSEIYDTHVTTLDNGLRVASEKLFGDFCTVGVIIEAGPRFEKPLINGITHFVEKLAFNTTSSYTDRDHILQLLEKNSAISDCQSGRDAVIYALSCQRSGLPEILNLLSEAIHRPIIKEHDLEQARQAIEFEIEEVAMRPDPEPILSDMVHYSAYKDSTLGNPKMCPRENIEKIDPKAIYSYMRSHYQPKRMVLACVGVDHEEFVKLAKENFANKTPIWTEDSSLCDSKYGNVIDTTKSKWVGGETLIERDLSDVYQGQNQLPEVAHLVVGLESPAYGNEKDFVASCVINMLMGGGGSFSAGGPGKGMYSRLYLNVLNRYHFMFNATAFNQSYSDSGLFCINASAPPEDFNNMCIVIGKELLRMRGPCDQEELSRAKTQLQSMLFMNLEQRAVQFEDIARQVLSRNRREKAQYYFDRIQAIKEEDIQRVASQMLSSVPAVAAYGRVSSFKPFERIQEILSSKESKSRFKKTFFGV